MNGNKKVAQAFEACVTFAIMFGILRRVTKNTLENSGIFDYSFKHKMIFKTAEIYYKTAEERALGKN